MLFFEELADAELPKVAAVQEEEPKTVHPTSVLPDLKKAKQHSDRKEYTEKADILRRLMMATPADWFIDQPEKYHQGITHKPTKFKFHAPRRVIPPSVKIANTIKLAQRIKQAVAVSNAEKAFRSTPFQSPAKYIAALRGNFHKYQRSDDFVRRLTTANDPMAQLEQTRRDLSGATQAAKPMIDQVVEKFANDKDYRTEGAIAGGAVAASSPMASLLQYLFVKYPKLRQVIEDAPELAKKRKGEWSKGTKHLNKILQPGDVGIAGWHPKFKPEISSSAPFDYPLGAGAAYAGGAPGIHAVTVGPVATKGVNKGLPTLLHGGQYYPRILADPTHSVLQNTADTVADTAGALWKRPVRHWLKLIRGYINRGFRQHGQWQAETDRVLPRMSGKPGLVNATAIKSPAKEVAKYTERPYLFMRSKEPLTAAQSASMHGQMLRDAPTPYNLLGAGWAGLKRLFVPDFNTNATNHVVKPLEACTSGHCSSIPARMLQAGGLLSRDVNAMNQLPGDLLTNDKLKAVGVFRKDLMHAGLTRSAIGRGTLGLGATVLAAAAGAVPGYVAGRLGSKQQPGTLTLENILGSYAPSTPIKKAAEEPRKPHEQLLYHDAPNAARLATAPLATDKVRGAADAVRKLIWNIKHDPQQLNLRGYKPQAGDVYLYRNVDEGDGITRRLYSLLNGGNQRLHASVVLPDAEGKLRVVLPVATTSNPTSPTNFPGLGWLKRQVERKGVGPLLYEQLSSLWSGKPSPWAQANELGGRVMDRVAAAKPSPAEVSRIISEELSPKDWLRSPGQVAVEVFRPSQPLSKADHVRMVENLSQYANTSTMLPDELASGVGNLLGKHTSQRNFIPQPSYNCAGGVCNVYSGVRNLPSSKYALPEDIATSPLFTSLGRYAYRGKQMPSQLSNLLTGAGNVALRGTMATAALAPAMYGAYGLLHRPAAAGSKLTVQNILGNYAKPALKKP